MPNSKSKCRRLVGHPFDSLGAALVQNPIASFSSSMPIHNLPVSTTLRLSTSYSIPTFESAVQLAVSTLLRLASPSLTLSINPAALRFTLSTPVSTTHNPLDLNSPLYPLSALSTLEFTTRTKDSLVTQLIRGGVLLESSTKDSQINHLRQDGTTLDVWELFHPLPVRLRVEAARHPLQIQVATYDVVAALSLANPHVTISLYGPTNHLLYTSCAGPLSVDMIQGAFGNVSALDWCSVSGGVIKNGFVARRGCSSSSITLVSVDGTPVTERGWVHKAATRVWRSYVAKTLERKALKYPAYVLNCKGGGEEVYVWKNAPSEEAERAVLAAIASALEGVKKERKKQTKMEVTVSQKKRKIAYGRFAESMVCKRRRVSIWEGREDIRKELMRPLSEAGGKKVRSLVVRERLSIGRPRTAEGIEGAFRNNLSSWENPCFRARARVRKISEWKGEDSREGLYSMFGKRDVSIAKERISKLRIVGQVERKFIVVMDEEAVMYAIDQHAASERYMYETLLRNTSHDEIVSTELTLPKTMKVSYGQRVTALCHASTLGHWGWHVRVVDEGVQMICAPYLKSLEVLVDDEEALCGYLECLQRGAARQLIPTSIAQVIASAACHAAVRFGDELCMSQCESLVRSLSECESPFICAHGRPSIVPLAVFDEQ